MILGFTGTRHGTTPEQHKALCDWLQAHPPAELHHGCCVGADAEAHDALRAYCRGARSVGHPPCDTRLVSASCRALCDELRPAKPYLVRNQDIADECDLLLACPKGSCERLQSGTWSTVRRARKAGKRAVIIWPDGAVTEE